MHVDNCGHTSDWKNVEILDRGNSKNIRGFLEAWHSDQSAINKHIEIYRVYQPIKKIIDKHTNKKSNQREIQPRQRSKQLQYQVMRKLKLTAEQSNHELNNVIESLSNMLHRSRKQNIRTKRTIESIKMHLIKLYDTIKQLNIDNNQSENNTSQSLENMNSKVRLQLISLLLAYMHPVHIALIHKHFEQRWIAASIGIQDARFVSFKTRTQCHSLQTPSREHQLRDAGISI
ncbi:unnamed protein product [Schistosoma mattheei]|uniref:Uncharacterized protein n=1 Tax=Schistosoma mattheei TaxID=31246 RepID=A0A183PVQ9_9TREM|nr:unnamed protein product [Schistosoma mattheei]